MADGRIQRVTVLGAEVLGGQISWHSAFKGKTVVIYDPFPEALAKATAAHEGYAQIYRGQLGASDGDIGEGFYRYPNPAYAAPDFLALPDASIVPVFVERALLK